MPAADWAPAVADVGALLHARTKDANGAELGVFTENTRPTEAQVQAIIDNGVLPEVEAEIGGEIDARWWPLAKGVVTLLAAMQVELSYYPEQVASGRSPYEQMHALVHGAPGQPGRLARLIGAMAEVEEGGEVGAGDDNLARFSFPVDMGGLVGWGTEW